MSSQKKPQTKRPYEDMSDQDLEDTLKHFSLNLSEALREQRKRKDELIEEARKDYHEASKKLADLGGFRDMHIFTNSALGHGSLFASRLANIFDG